MASIGLIDHFNITIAPSQLDATVRFYRDVLGLVQGARPNFRNPGVWLYGDGHPVLHVTVREGAARSGPTASLDHVALRARGLNEIRARLAAEGLKIEEQRVADNTMHQIFLRDPNGLMIELDFALNEEGVFKDEVHAERAI